MTLYLIINGLLFFIVGLRALLKPVDAVAVPFELTADAPAAKSYLRSGAGGVTLACAGVMLAGGFIAKLTLAALILSVGVLGGLVFGRLVSLALDGNPGPIVWVAWALETLGFLFGAYWLWVALA